MRNQPSDVTRRAMLGSAAVGVAGLSVGSAVAQESGSASVTTASADGTIHVPARDIPVPPSVSQEGRAYLTQLARMPTMTGTGGVTDVAAIKARIAKFDRTVGGFYRVMAGRSNTQVSTQTMGGVTVYVAHRNEATLAELRKIHLYIHGGGFMTGGGSGAMYQGQLEARRYGGTVVSVDYRMAPDYPFPAAIDDVFAVYRELLRTHPAAKIMVSGESAGGNLSAALMHKAKDNGLPKAAAVFLFTPAVDMAVRGDSRVVNLHADVVLKDGAGTGDDLYVAGANRSNPYLSPLYGDLAAAFPPTYLRSGTRDLLLSDSARMHAALRKAGVDAELYIGEGMPHTGFPDAAPEQIDAIADTNRWLERHWR